MTSSLIPSSRRLASQTPRQIIPSGSQFGPASAMPHWLEPILEPCKRLVTLWSSATVVWVVFHGKGAQHSRGGQWVQR